MTRSHTVLGILFVAVFGIYGCAQGPTAAHSDDRTPALEAKIQRLEEDFRAAAAARDTLRQRLTATEEKQAAAVRLLDQTRTAAAREREMLAAEVKVRTTERDMLQVQYDAFRRTLKELIGQAETSAAPVAPTPTAAGESSALRN